MAVLEARRIELGAQLEAAPPPMVRLHPNLAELYRQKVINLAKPRNSVSLRDALTGAWLPGGELLLAP